MTGISASTALAHRQKLTLWTMSARIGGECRVYRSTFSMPDISVSGIARWARAGLFQPRIATIITTKKSAQPTSALPELSHATAAPASAGPTARATLKATAPRATARGISMRATRSCPDARRLGRQVECETGADQEREREERHGSGGVQQGDDAERRGGREQDDLRDDDHASPVDEVRQRSGEESQQQRRRGARRLHERHHERRRCERGHEPCDDGGLGSVAQGGAHGSDVELPEGGVPERGRTKELRGQRGNAVGHGASVAWHRNPGLAGGRSTRPLPPSLVRRHRSARPSWESDETSNIAGYRPRRFRDLPRHDDVGRAEQRGRRARTTRLRARLRRQFHRYGGDVSGAAEARHPGPHGKAPRQLARASRARGHRHFQQGRRTGSAGMDSQRPDRSHGRRDRRGGRHEPRAVAHRLHRPLSDPLAAAQRPDFGTAESIRRWNGEGRRSTSRSARWPGS